MCIGLHNQVHAKEREARIRFTPYSHRGEAAEGEVSGLPRGQRPPGAKRKGWAVWGPSAPARRAETKERAEFHRVCGVVMDHSAVCSRHVYQQREGDGGLQPTISSPLHLTYITACISAKRRGWGGAAHIKRPQTGALTQTPHSTGTCCSITTTSLGCIMGAAEQ